MQARSDGMAEYRSFQAQNLVSLPRRVLFHFLGTCA